MASVANRISLITGGTSGIGLVTAKKMAQRGASVVITGRRKDLGQEIEKELRSVSKNCMFIQGSVTDPDQVNRVMDQIQAHFGALDYLFNNAGIEGHFQPLQNHTTQEILDVMNTNLIGPMLCTHSALPLLNNSKHNAVIVNNSSVASCYNRRMPTLSVYGTSKGGLDTFTRYASGSLAPLNIKVYSVNPMLVRTDMLDRLAQDFRVDKVEEMSKLNPSRTLATPEQIAEVVMAMFDGSTLYESGDIVLVDSGYTWNADVMYTQLCKNEKQVGVSLDNASDYRGAPIVK